MHRTIDEHCIEEELAPDDVRHASAATPGNGARVIDLSLAGKGNYVAKRGTFTELVWFFLEAAIINNKFIPVSGIRVWLLRRFGARIGSGCRMPHPIRVKARWNLEVGDNCWFGVNCVITSGVTIGERCVIGANSVVTKDIPAGSIAAGAPARVIRPIEFAGEEPPPPAPVA